MALILDTTIQIAGCDKIYIAATDSDTVIVLFALGEVYTGQKLHFAVSSLGTTLQFKGIADSGAFHNSVNAVKGMSA